MFRYHKLKLIKRKQKFHQTTKPAGPSSSVVDNLDQQQQPQSSAQHSELSSSSSEQEMNIPEAPSFPIEFTRTLKRYRYKDSSASTSDFSEYSYCSTDTEEETRPRPRSSKRKKSPSTLTASLMKSVPMTNPSSYASEEDSIESMDSTTDGPETQSSDSSTSENGTCTAISSRKQANYVQTKKSTRMTFDDYFEQIKFFKKCHGHMRVTPKHDKKLANWIADMRNIRRQKNKCYGRKVTEEQLKSLDDLGFIWNPTKEAGGEKSFEHRIEQLRKFKEEHGHLRVTVKHDKNLSYFCSNIRAARRHAGRRRILKVTKERIKALDDLGFAWEPKPTQGDLAFWNHIKEMRAFKKKHGHVHITAQLDKKLAIFCTNMRNARRKTHTTRRLTEDRIKALDDLGFIWDPGQGRTLTTFEERVEQLKKYKEYNGHLKISPKEDINLFNFCNGIRNARLDPGRGRMVVTDAKIRALDEIGFDWWDNSQSQSKHFDACFDSLKKFKERHGHLRVTSDIDENLSQFCENIRNARRLLDGSGRLRSSGRIKELDQLGFEWNSSG